MSKNAMRTDNRQNTEYYTKQGDLRRREHAYRLCQTLTEGRKDGQSDGESVKAKDFCRASWMVHKKQHIKLNNIKVNLKFIEMIFTFT